MTVESQSQKGLTLKQIAQIPAEERAGQFFYVELPEPDPREVDQAYEELTGLTPIQQIIINRARHRYAEEHGLPFRTPSPDWKGIFKQLFHL